MGQVSLVIASLNGERTLPEALASVAVQEIDGAVEILLADNGSTDRTREVFEHFAASNPRFASRVIDASARRGKSYALNTAIAAAKGERILFLDDDDAFAPGYIGAMSAALDEHPFVCAKVDCALLNPPDLYGLRARNEENEDRFTDIPPFCRIAAGGTLGFRREVFEVVGGFCEKFPAAQDYEFCLRAALAGYQLTRAPEAVYHYRYRTEARATYRQQRSYAAAYVALRARHANEPRAFSLRAWALLGRQYLRILRFRLARLHRPVTAYERHFVAMRLGNLDGLMEGAKATGLLPTNFCHDPRSVAAAVPPPWAPRSSEERRPRT